MRKVLIPVLMSVSVTMVGAGDLSAPNAVAQKSEKSANAPASGATLKDLKTTGKLKNGAPHASKKPTVPLLFLDEKNLGLGCAQPS